MYKPDVPSICTPNLLQLTCRRLTPQEVRKTGFSDISSLNLFIYVLGKAGLSSSVYILVNTSNFLLSTRFKLSWWAVCFRFALPAAIWFILWMGSISRNSSGVRFTVSFVYCTACVFVETNAKFLRRRFVSTLQTQTYFRCITNNGTSSEIFYLRNTVCIVQWNLDSNVGPRDLENLFAMPRFRYIEVLFHIFYYHWGKENRSSYRGHRSIEFVISRFHCTGSRRTAVKCCGQILLLWTLYTNELNVF